ncbi:MAG TPA: MopE-related protein [Polyangiaceae bacterium LLY-WYZ-14_1]|nr:MopE-related protein [Polyangiaceae bacterium LLY-WYZ-14_1]
MDFMSRSVLLLTVFLAAACSASPDADNDLDGFDFTEDCDDFDPQAYPGAEELCGGRDEDCDGRIDEGLPDLDDDGDLDCNPDRSCEIPTVEPRRNQAAQTCPENVVEDPWGMRELWRWEAVLDTPAPISDSFAVAMNKDGSVTIYFLAGGDPETNPGRAGFLVSVDAATGLTNWARRGPWNAWSGVVAADIDDDGEIEVVVSQVLDPQDPEQRGTGLVAVSADNEVEWESESFCDFDCVGSSVESPFQEDCATVSRDLCNVHRTLGGGNLTGGVGSALLLTRLQDRVKIALTNAVIDGGTGRVEVKIEVTQYFGKGMAPLAVHRVPALGTALFLRWTLFDPMLERRWSITPEPVWRLSSPMVYDLDIDDVPEISIFSLPFGGLIWHQFDSRNGDEVASFTSWESGFFAYSMHGVTVGDIDGDGVSEEVRGTSHKFGPRYDSALSINPREDQAPILTFRRDVDPLDVADSLAAFDFDGDGTMEVVGRYGARFFILSEGEIVASVNPDGDAGFQLVGSAVDDFQKPTVVADIDGDGQAEIITHFADRPGTYTGLVAYEHAGSGWMPAGSNWNQTPFRPEEFLEDGTVVGDPPVDYSLESGTMLNARPIAAPHTELELRLAGSCAASCAGEVRVALRVANHGATVVREGEVDAVVRDEAGEVIARTAVPPTPRREESDLFELVVPDTGLLPSPDQVTVELAFAEPTAQCSTDDDAVTIELPPACAALR